MSSENSARHVPRNRPRRNVDASSRWCFLSSKFRLGASVSAVSISAASVSAASVLAASVLAASVLAVWLGMAASVLAQAPSGAEPTETFRGETSTVMVEVPVEVTLDGAPVRGLTADNFEIVDAGDRQEILGLDVVDLTNMEAEPGEPADPLPVVARRHFLLLFDFSFSKPASVERARRAALELVQNDLHAADLVAVATHSLNQGVNVRLAFTPDRGQVEVALAGLGSTESVAVRSDPLKLFVGQLDRSIDADIGNTAGSGGERGGIIDERYRLLQTMVDKAQATQGRREISAMARALGELGTLLRSVDGRKHVVFFSEGFDGKLLLGATDQQRRNQLSRQAQTGSVQDFATLDSAEYFGSTESLNVLEKMSEEFRRSDCTVHAVDIGGLRADNVTAGGQVGGSKDGLFMMASGTGGGFFENFNDLGTAMEDLLEQTSVTYVLSYQPSDLKWNGKYRKLKVKLKDLPKKARIVHRPGYFAPDAAAGPDQGLATQLDLAQRLWDGREGGTIAARILAVPLQTEARRQGAKAYVPVLVEVDGPSFLQPPVVPAEAQGKRKKSRRGKGKRGKDRPQNGTGEARAEVFVYAIDKEGKVADFFSQSIGLGAANQGAAFREQGMKVYAPLQLDEGDYELRLLVRNSGTGMTGLRVGRVEVPAPNLDRPTLLPPFFPESVDAWVLVRGRRQDLNVENAPAYPFFHGPTVYVPAVRPQLRPGDVLPVFLAGYGLGGVRQLDSEVVDAWGRSAQVPRWRLDDRMQEGEDDLQRYVAAFETPELNPGIYTLNMSLTNEDGVSTDTASLEFEIVLPGTKPRGRLLTLDSPPSFGPREAETVGATYEASSSMSTRLSRDREPAESLGLPQVEATYGEILADLGNRWGEPELVAQLVNLERQAVAGDEARLTSRLRRSQMKAARALAGKDPELYVPLIQLHTDTYRTHREMRRPYLVHHSQEMVRGLAEEYARQGDSEGSRVTAARALASLGGYLQADGRQASMKLFYRSLELDPANEAALLGLAAFHEKRGGPYEESAKYLSRLVERRGTSREGRLRLAVNLLRIADHGTTPGRARYAEEAAEHLQRLLDGPENDWIYSLAAQEAARRLAKDGERGQAIEVLEKAVERMPDEQKLHVHLTYLLDRGQRSYEAGKRARHLVDSLATQAPAARGLYNQWPRQALDADRRELADGAAQRAATLVQVDARDAETGAQEEGR